MDYQNINFARRIRERRKANNLTQLQLAKLMGVGQSVIARFESGSLVPSVARLYQLDSLLGGGIVNNGSVSSNCFYDLQDKLLEMSGAYIDNGFALFINGQEYELDQNDLDELDRITNSAAEFFEYEFNKLLDQIKAKRYGQ